MRLIQRTRHTRFKKDSEAVALRQPFVIRVEFQSQELQVDYETFSLQKVGTDIEDSGSRKMQWACIACPGNLEN